MKLSKFNLDKIKDLEQKEKDAKEKKKDFSILCVDDEEANLKALRNLLEDQYNVFTANSPIEAERILETTRVEVIITDQRMPEKLGTEFLDTLTQRKLTDNIRIILTGFSDVSVLLDCINKGLVDRYMLKPWAPDEMLTVVKKSIEKVTMQRTLDKMLPEKVLNKLYPEGLGNIKVGHGKELKCVILFADLWSFTKLTDGVRALDSFRLVSSYFNHIAPMVNKFDGFIDKYLGDGMMAIFDRDGDYYNDCIECAIEVIKETANYNKTHRSFPPPEHRKDQTPREPLRVGIGLYSGEVVLGTVGFADRIEFTVLGDSVNTASRVQSLTSFYKTHILISDEVAKNIKPQYAKRYIGKHPLKGKVNDLEIWEVFEADPDDLKQKKLEQMDDFNRAIKFMDDKDLDQAYPIFDELAKKNPADNVVRYIHEHMGKRMPHIYSRKDDV